MDLQVEALGYIYPGSGILLGTAFAQGHVPIGSNHTGVQNLPLFFEIIGFGNIVVLKLRS